MKGAKTLTELGTLMGRQTEANCERLRSFLASYAAANDGATPAYDVMGNQLGIAVEGVRVLLAKLENKGVIHFISRNPPRIMLVGKDAPPHEPGPADLGLAKEGAAGRYLDVEGERMRLGRYIASTIRDTGHAPSLAQMKDFVGFGTIGYVSRMAEILAERGLIQYGHGVPTRLTEQGQQFFGVRPPQAMEQPKMANNDSKPVVVVRQARGPVRPIRAKVRLLCETLAAYIRADPERGNYTGYRTFAADMGYAAQSSNVITGIANEAIRLGYIEPKQPRTHGLFFTEKGRAKFMPETVEAHEKARANYDESRSALADHMAAGEASIRTIGESLKMETPIVAQVAAIVGHRSEARGSLDFNLTSSGISVNGSTQSGAELRNFAAKLTGLAALLGE